MSNLSEFPSDSETLALHTIISQIVENHDLDSKDVTRLHCMCYDLELTTKYLLAPEIKEFVSNRRLEVYGYGSADAPYQIPELPAVTFHPTAKRIEAHYTTIEIHGKPLFAFYEDDHNPEKERKFLWSRYKNNIAHTGSMLLLIENKKAYAMLFKRELSRASLKR